MTASKASLLPSFTACLWATGTALSDWGVHKLDEIWQSESAYWSRHALKVERMAGPMSGFWAGPVNTWQASMCWDADDFRASSYDQYTTGSYPMLPMYSCRHAGLEAGSKRQEPTFLMITGRPVRSGGAVPNSCLNAVSLNTMYAALSHCEFM